jgi:spermidine synthase
MRLRATIFVTGMSSVIAQTLVMREGLTLFGGYEIVSGILLCFWLVWGGMGSVLFTRMRFKTEPHNVVSVLLFIQCFCMLYSMIFLRCSRWLFALPYGEVISLGNILAISCLSLAPLCMVFGALFPAITMVLEPGYAYLFEGVGAFAGGILVTFVLIHVVPPVGIILLVIVALLSCGFMLRRRAVLAVLCMAIIALLAKAKDMEFFLRQIQMPDQKIVAMEESRYGLITITQTSEQTNFYTSGIYDFSFPDPYTTEEAVHYSLLLHNKPEEVLLIGGGVSSCLDQILKHDVVQRITYVELDPLLFFLGSEYILTDRNYGDKVQIVFGDARFYIKNTLRKYDVVIINLPDPVNAQLNRFYTREFFSEVHDVLKPGGICSIRISAPIDIISRHYGELLHTLERTMKQTYQSVLVLPASQMTYIASDHIIDAYSVRTQLKQSLENRNLDLQYVNSYFFDFELTPEKIDYVQQRIDDSKATVNSDLKPACYYYTMILWGGVLSESIRNMFVRLFNISPWFFLLPLVLIFLFYRRRSLVYLSVIAIGASEISAEVILIILFQIFYGYLYGWIGAIIASYMLGLAIGTFLYLKTNIFRNQPVIVLSNVEFIMGSYFLIMLGITVVSIPGINIVIPILIFCGGVIGGLHFPLSVAILHKEKAGIIYGIDLIGSAFGALITSVVLIPIIGIRFALLIFIVLNALVGAGLRTLRKH